MELAQQNLVVLPLRSAQAGPHAAVGEKRGPGGLGQKNAAQLQNEVQLGVSSLLESTPGDVRRHVEMLCVRLLSPEEMSKPKVHVQVKPRVGAYGVELLNYALPGTKLLLRECVLSAFERILRKIEVASRCTPRRGVRSREDLRNP